MQDKSDSASTKDNINQNINIKHNRKERIENTSQPFLEIKNLTKKYGEVTAVDNVSFNIEKGHIFALLGPSGCGKSTMLRMLAGFEIPSSGQMLLQGKEISNMPSYNRPINMMFQSYALFPHLTVADNIAFGLKREHLPKAEIAERVEQMLTLVQMKAYAMRKPHQLSGGQQQRVALARALAKKPSLLLLDEPLGALDKKLREQMQWELAKIIYEVGVTCLMVTHDQEEAMTMADRMAVMSYGEIAQIGKPHQIYETPVNRFIADFIGNVNLFEGTIIVDEADHCVVDTKLTKVLIGHGITGSLGIKVSVALRLEKVEITRDLTAKEFNHIPCQVLDFTYFGHFTVYLLEAQDGSKIKASYPNTERDGERFRVGEKVMAYWENNSPVLLRS